eukprot:sb/3475122/
MESYSISHSPTKIIPGSAALPRILNGFWRRHAKPKYNCHNNFRSVWIGGEKNAQGYLQWDNGKFFSNLGQEPVSVSGDRLSIGSTGQSWELRKSSENLPFLCMTPTGEISSQISSEISSQRRYSNSWSDI